MLTLSFAQSKYRPFQFSESSYILKVIVTKTTLLIFIWLYTVQLYNSILFFLL